MIYSFVVLSYNQEKYIIEHLESIKWQIEQYGSRKKIQLIIADDCSKDRTVEYAKQWIDKNTNLFIDTKICVNPQNGGVASNAVNGFRAIIGDVFSYVAADDMYSMENVFEYLDWTSRCDVIDSAILPFSMLDGKYGISGVSYQVFKKKLAKQYLPNRFLRVFSAATLIIGGPTYAFSKNILTEENLSYVESFEMCEDRPLAQIIFKKENVVRKYIPKPMILQRNTPGSVTRSSKLSVVQQKCIRDMMRIYDENISDKNIWVRIVARIGKLYAKSGNKLALVFNPYYTYILIVSLIKKKEIEQVYVSNFQQKIAENQKHLLLIQQNANLFYRGDK